MLLLLSSECLEKTDKSLSQKVKQSNKNNQEKKMTQKNEIKIEKLLRYSFVYFMPDAWVNSFFYR
jgi:hypothetical protein